MGKSTISMAILFYGHFPLQNVSSPEGTSHSMSTVQVRPGTGLATRVAPSSTRLEEVATSLAPLRWEQWRFFEVPWDNGCFVGTSWEIWVCLKMLCTPKPNGFADHYPYEKCLFHWEY